MITAVLKDPGDKTKVRSPQARTCGRVLTCARIAQVSLIFANQTEEDILCRKVRPNRRSRTGLADAVCGAGAGSAGREAPEL